MCMHRDGQAVSSRCTTAPGQRGDQHKSMAFVGLIEFIKALALLWVQSEQFIVDLMMSFPVELELELLALAGAECHDVDIGGRVGVFSENCPRCRLRVFSMSRLASDLR